MRAIKLDRQFSSFAPSFGSDSSSSSASQAAFSGRDMIDRKSIIQDLFATLPSAERTLLEDEIGKLATGVRANTSSTLAPRQDTSTSARRPLMAESSLSASWEDVGASTGSPVRSAFVSVLSAAGAGRGGRTTPTPGSTTGKVSQPTMTTPTPASPFASRVTFGHQAPPTPKFTAFGSPIPSTTGVSMGRGVITERAKTLFSSNAVGGPSAPAKPAAHVSLFDTAGSAKNAPNAFYKPPSAQAAKTSIDVSSAFAGSSTAKSTEQSTNVAKQNGKAHGGESDGEDVSMESESDVEIAEEDRRGGSSGEEDEEEGVTDEEVDAENFLTYDTSGAADLTLHARHADEMMNDGDEAGPELGFSLFSGARNATQNGSVSGQGKKGISGIESISHPSRRARVSPSRGGDMSLSASVGSTTTSRSRAPPGAFHPEEEDEEEDRHDENENVRGDDTGKEDEDHHMLQTTPIQSSRRSSRARRQSETPTHSSTRSQPQRHLKSATTATGGTSQPSTRSRRTSSRQTLSHTIPGALMDEDNDEHGQDDAHGDADTEMDEQEEEDDAIAPLPSRASRRTRSSGLFGTSTKSKSSAKPAVPAKASATATASKGKTKARPSEPKTPTRRSSRLSVASSASPEYTDLASPTKGRKGTGSRASVAESGTVATRSSTRRKR